MMAQTPPDDGSGRGRRPLRVAIVAPSMRILGGQAVQAQRLLDAWRDDPDVDARLVPVNPLPPRGLRWATRVKFVRTVATQLAYWPLLARELARADLVHVFSASYFSFVLAPLPAVLVARLLGRPVILNYRSGEAPDHLERSALARTTLARVDCNVVPSRFLLDVFGSFGLRAEVIPNIVDVDRFRFRLRRRLRPRLVSTRNFESLYNVACTLRAFQLVQRRYPDATLTLVGSGSREASLRRLAAELSLRGVTFAGRVSPSDIWRHYADADIYVQTPDIDNMPSSVLEAFASGAVVVSTDAGGVPAIVTDGANGLLVPCDDHLAIADRVLRLLDDPDLAMRLATAGRDQCDQYRWDRVREKWLSVYRDVYRPGLAERVLRPKPDGSAAVETPGIDASNVSSAHRSLPLDVARGSQVVGGRQSSFARLRGMDSGELRFRARTGLMRTARRIAALGRSPAWRRSDLAARLDGSHTDLQPSIDRLKARDWAGAHEALVRYFQRRPCRFVLDPNSRRTVASAVSDRFPRSTEAAANAADKIVGGEYDLLGYEGLRFDPPQPTDGQRQVTGAKVDWSLDPVHGAHAASGWWSGIDYLDPANGDHKIVWELNRHQHWLTLGRAYWLTGRERYRRRFIEELESWLVSNPPLVGINWASMLEVALRSLSWIWALHFFLDDPRAGWHASGNPPWLVDLLLGLDRQMRQVQENLSCYFSPNTHLTGEALGLYVTGRVLPEFANSRRWADTGRRVLMEEASRQVANDGGHLERSTHYHRYTLDFYLLALAIARVTGDAAAEEAFEPLVVRLARFARGMADAAGWLPRIGDDDAGMLMPLATSDPGDVRASLSIAASLLPGRVSVDEVAEETLWFAAAAPTAAARPTSGEWDRSTAFPDTGYYVSRTRSGDHAVIDAGAHGYLNGGHAHADALAMTLSLRWHRFLVDGGTGTYTMDARARDRFRSTALHNALVLDGRSQAQPDGPFHWRTTADGRLVRWVSNPGFDFFDGVHDAYAPAAHRRMVFSDGGDLWLVADHVLDDGPHEAAVHWHLDPAWRTEIESLAIGAVHDSGLRVTMATTARRLDLFHGDEATGLGWCSPAYGRVVPCPTVRFSHAGDGPFSIVTAIAPDARHVALAPISVVAAAGAHVFAVRLVRGDVTDVALFTVLGDDAGNAGALSRCDCFETDARFAHVRLDASGSVGAVSLVDATTFRQPHPGGAHITLAAPVHDLLVVFAPDGTLELFSAASTLPSLTLEGVAERVSRVRFNDAGISFERTGDRIVAPSATEPAPHGVNSSEMDLCVELRDS